MSHDKIPATPGDFMRGLNVEQLDVGLRILNGGLVDANSFWDENIAAFRQTLLVAICETSDALLSPRTSLTLRIELKTQLESLVQHVEVADRYIARRLLSFEHPARQLPLSEPRIH